MQTTSGQPGDASDIRIRGVGSVFSNQAPLVVVDGIIGGSYNPNDIESMSVLKDASATAIYGSRGANGVVIITSKRGSTGKPRVTFDSYLGVKSPSHLPKMQDAQEYFKSSITDAICMLMVLAL